MGAENDFTALPQLIGNGPLQRRHLITDRQMRFKVNLLRPDRADRKHLEGTFFTLDTDTPHPWPEAELAG